MTFYPGGGGVTPTFASATVTGLLTAGTLTTGNETESGTLGVTGLLSANGGTDTHTSTVVTTPVVSSGVAFTPSATKDTTVYFLITGGAAGTYTLTFGPTTGAENSLGTVAVPATTAELVSLKVPASWKVVMTVSTAVITSTVVVTQ